MHPVTVAPAVAPPGPLGGALAHATQRGPVVVYAWNPLKAHDRHVFRAEPGRSLNQLRPDSPLPTICILNGEPILAADWDYVPEEEEHVVFYTLPRGGGDGGSNPLTVILAIVVTVVGVFTGNPYLIAAGVSMLAVGLLPQPTFTPISAPTTNAEVSPTYSIQVQGNTARLGQSIPVVYGEHLLIPDFASQPYSEFDDNSDQFYHALFCLGMADQMAVLNTFIDDTPLAHFVEVQTQLIGPGYPATLTLVNPCVVNAPEVAQQDLLFGSIVGPFAASGPGLRCNKLGIDILCPKGLYYAEDDGTLSEKSISWMVEARKLTDSGAVSGSWFLLGTESITAADSKPIRRSYSYTVSPGRYQVRMQRTTERDDNTRAGHDIQWLGMRAYLTTTAPLDPNANYLALRIRATSQLSGLSQRKISVLVQRWLPVWDPITGWSAPQPTSSIAWAIADVLRNSVYGGALPDASVDLQTLYDLDALWASRGDEFNGIFDKRITIWNAMATIARAGRARPIMRGSVFTVVRDSAQELPVALFNMRNIQRGSFSVDYSMWTEDAADGVELEFFDETTWSSNYVVLPLPGATEDPVKPAKMSIVGITKLKQAQREAAYYVAEGAYRRTAVTFTTEMEGYLPGYGDLIAVAHDVTSWGSSGEFTEWNGIAAIASEEIDWSVGTNYGVLVDEQGDVHGPYRVASGARAREVRFIDAPPTGLIYTGYERERTRYAIGPANAYAKLCRVVSISPADNDAVQIRALVEDARVHTADLPYAGGGGSGGSSRVARYAPDELPTYDAASDAERGAYGFFSNEAGTVGTDEDPGYVYDN